MEHSGFFNSVKHDRKYKAEDWAAYFNAFLTNGVFPNPAANVQVKANGDSMKIYVDVGKAWINGYLYDNDSPLYIRLTNADGASNRIDRVVLRWSRADRSITAAVKQGNYATTPVAQDLERDADSYELGIADVAVNAGVTSIAQADITDIRLNTELCGIVNSLIQADTTAIFDQYLNWFSTKKSDYENDMSAAEAQYQASFEEWFSNVQDTLDSDTAGHLLNLIHTKAVHYSFDIDLPASGWTGDGPYTQTVSVSGLSAAMCPVMDLVQSDDVDTAQSQLDAYSYLDKAVTGDGTLTLTCYDFKPGVDITVHLEVVT
ncbi:MAG TPA: hypothetical protein DHW78_07305 [Ruminococcaceae bacterium]|jgi:hypothetical protein|nr:hypothetical protein [Oscillospiraceae bacterium]HCC02546.1 hypothetical protein [Oscillospiraceae bacterium]HCM24111.1 hypothetical protein [Oscillospiraceae bacterium]